MTLADRIERATTQFMLSSDYFAESILYYPGGSVADKETVVGIWDADNLPGRNQMEGEGANLETRGGRRIRQTILLELPASLEVDEHADPPDVFKRVSSGEVAALKRIVGKDNDQITVECVRNQPDASRYPARRA